MKKIIISGLLLILILSLTSCRKGQEFFSKYELEKFGLMNIEKPNNTSNYYNKSNNNMLMCYMNISKDDDVRDYVSNILEMLENTNVYEIYGYAKEDDMFKNKRNIYLSKNIDDYLVNTYNYSENNVSDNAYIIYYSLKNSEYKDLIFELSIISYTTERSNLYLNGYNLYIAVTKNNASNYTIIK